MANNPSASRKVFITGGSRGIGKAIADRFRTEGHEVIAPSREELDLSSPDSVRNYLVRHAGLEIDILINNAGENKINLIKNIPFEDWQRILTTNLSSAFMLIHAMAPGMTERSWGRVVNISSVYSLVSRQGRAAYSASKSGLNGLTRAAALEFGEFNVLVNAVCPGFVETEMTRKNNNPTQIEALTKQTALLRLAQPDEIAEFVHFLGSDKNTYITGQTIAIDGGFICQ